MPEIRLGMRVQDKVTGAIGTITAICEYLYGSPFYQFEYLDNNGSICSEWFEKKRLDIVEW